MPAEFDSHCYEFLCTYIERAITTGYLVCSAKRIRQRKRVAHKLRRMQDTYAREEDALQMLDGGEGGEAENIYEVADTLSDDDTAPTRSDESLSGDDMSGSAEAEEYDSDDSNF
eukprot:scaffold9154_cov117-Skeletonema_dohrnii-CCMP3373.AAC.1